MLTTQMNHDIPRPMALPFLARERLAELANGTLPPIDTVGIQRFALRHILRQPLGNSFRAIRINEEQLYRGCREPRQSVLQESYLTMIAGVYLSLSKEEARRYAVNAGILLRDEFVANPPVLYTCSIVGLNLLDLRGRADEDIVFNGFVQFLNNILESSSLDLLISLDRKWDKVEWQLLSNESEFREWIRSMGSPIRSSELDRKMQQRALNGTLAEYLTTFGLDGIIDADSNVLVFDSEKAKIIDEAPVSPKLRSLS